jgi:hypothetical protein
LRIRSEALWLPFGRPKETRLPLHLREFLQMIPGREGLISRLALIRPDGTGLRVLAAAGDHAGFPS